MYLAYAINAVQDQKSAECRKISLRHEFSYELPCMQILGEKCDMGKWFESSIAAKSVPNIERGSRNWNIVGCSQNYDIASHEIYAKFSHWRILSKI